MQHAPGARVQIVKGRHALPEHLAAHVSSDDVGIVVQAPSLADRGFVVVKFSRCSNTHRFFDDEVRLAELPVER
jgi:hypothetical protein